MRAARKGSQDFNSSTHDSKPESLLLFLNTGSKEDGYGARGKLGLAKFP